MIRRHRKCVHVRQMLLLLLTLGITTPHEVWCAATAPVDYLIPPPPPSASVQSPAARLNPARPSNTLASESRTVPQYAVNNVQTLAKTANEPGFISRMARWFGFSNQNYSQDQQQSAASTNNQLYYYARPQHTGTGNKEPCNLCNKYPWVPMMHNGVLYPWDPTKQNQLPGYNSNSYVRNNQPPVPQIQHAASNVKQRAVQFHYPPPPPHASAPIVPISSSQVSIAGVQQSPKQMQYSSGPFIPIPIPNLSNSAQPPVYNAQPFHDPNSVLPPLYPAQAFHQASPATSFPPVQQQLPSTETVHFADSIASAHSEVHLDTVIPTQIPPSIPNNDPSFEIVKSHQLADYISSVEYPASFVQTHSFDVHSGSSTAATNHQPEIKPAVSTGRYQHSTLSPYLNQHIPASQILTEPGSFVVDNHYQQKHQQQSALQSQIYEQSTLQHEAQSSVNDQGYEFDNYASASIQNSSVVENGNYDTWTLESNDYLYATTTPEEYSNTEVETTTTLKPDVYTTTEPPQSNDVEFVASVQTSKQNTKSLYTTKLWPQKPRDRETPKRLLDSPIQHIGSGSLGAPRPFTRDPSDLGLRAGAKNHKFVEQMPFQHTVQTISPASPTPTSTYSSVDASGHFAGMSPPAMPTQANKQTFIPFTTKNQPRPFESTRDVASTTVPPTSSFSSWIHSQNTDLHTPAETMLVHVKSELDPVSPTTLRPRTTKYLTKILASNLRELLQREHTSPSKLKHSPNALSFDLHALQKNIDDWTEQEYTSLSHRPSTPTILGRSKHIPKEFLPSTTTSTSTATVKPQRQSKTTKGFLDTSELSASVNSLEPLYERGGTKRFQFTAINDNHIQDSYVGREFLKYKTTSPPFQTTTTTTTTSTTSKPLYHIDMVDEEPEELWRKAKVSISPKTKEKVYVVTPQPIFFPQRQVSSTSTTTTERSAFPGLGSAFKSPRFLVRPTPGNGTSESSSSRHKYIDTSQERFANTFFIPDQIGLRGLSAYVPSEPVEIIDGNSKVLKTVKSPRNLDTITTPQNIMDLTKDRHAASKKKNVMEPSPR